MKRTFAVMIVLALLAFPSLSTAEEMEPNGNFWRDLEIPIAKYAMMFGFLEGRNLGYNFAHWGFDYTDEACFKKVVDSFEEYNKYAAHVTSSQLSDGLDSFYSDYRNRKIRMTDAVWVVLKSISGTPQAEIDKLTEKYRSIDK